MNMKKYFAIINIMWQRALTYRFTVAAYRIGELFEVLILILMWTNIYSGNTIIKGYTLQEMITYILIGNLAEVIVRNWMSGKIAEEIHNGHLSISLIKPINYFCDIFFREIGRISLAFFMSIMTQTFLLIFFLDKIVINHSLAAVSIMTGVIMLAFIIELLISCIIGLLAFWIEEVDGVYTTISRLKKFLAGGYFPINLLPAIYVKISLLLPFVYSFYVPTQIYLNKMSIQDGVRSLGGQAVWIVLLSVIITVVWKKGIKRYEGVGI